MISDQKQSTSMEQHPENPLGNHVPTGVNEESLLDAVRASGYPLQSLVAKELCSQFEVTEEWGYSDRTTKEHRTLDVYAYRELAPAGAVRPGLHLLVECKRSELPFVFFPPGAPHQLWDFPTIVGIGQLSLGIPNGTQEASPAMFFCADELPFVAAPSLAVAFTRTQRKSGKALELSGDVPFNQIVMPLASAVEQVRQVFRGFTGTPVIILTVCVCDAPMILALGTPEQPEMRLEPWVRVIHQETFQDVNHWRRRSYGIDFVHRQFLHIYLTRHALPFAEGLSSRMVQCHQKFPKAIPNRPKNLSWDEFARM